MTDADPDPTRVEHTTVFAADGGGAGRDLTPPEGTLPPSEPPPDRRPWIIVALLALIVVLLLLVLLLQDDGDDDSASSTTSSTEQTTSTSESTTSTTAGTTTTESSTTSAPPVVTVPPAECAEAGENGATPGLAAEALYDAWVRGDEACAAELATPAALSELFSRDGTDADDQFQGCTEADFPDPHADCAFTYEGGSTHYLMNFSPTEGWQAFDITQVAD